MFRDFCHCTGFTWGYALHTLSKNSVEAAAGLEDLVPCVAPGAGRKTGGPAATAALGFPLGGRQPHLPAVVPQLGPPAETVNTLQLSACNSDDHICATACAFSLTDSQTCMQHILLASYLTSYLARQKFQKKRSLSGLAERQYHADT